MATNNSRPGPDIQHVLRAMREHDEGKPQVEPAIGEDGPPDVAEAARRDQSPREADDA